MATNRTLVHGENMESIDREDTEMSNSKLLRSTRNIRMMHQLDELVNKHKNTSILVGVSGKFSDAVH